MLKRLRREWKLIENELDEIIEEHCKSREPYSREPYAVKQTNNRFRTSLRRHNTIHFIDIY